MTIDEFGYYERTYRLKTKDGKYAWFYDDTGENRFGDLIFDNEKEATKYAEKGRDGTHATFVNQIRHDNN